MNTPVYLAPMDGVTDFTMRHLLTQLGGIDRCFTEFLRITDLPLPTRTFLRCCPELASNGHTAAGIPVYLQILGSNAEMMAENAARAAALGAPGIDINFGCPAKTVNRHEGGAALLRKPKTIEQVVRAVRQATPNHIPVTAKIRLGYEDSGLFLENSWAIIEAGAQELTVHARTKIQGYKPPAYWRETATLTESSPIPIIINGEIWTPEQAQQALQQSQATGLMLGRGLLAYPDLGLHCKGLPSPYSGWPDYLKLLRRYLDLLIEHYEPRHLHGPIKQWLAYSQFNHPQAGALLQKIKRLKEGKELQQAFDEAISLSQPR